MWPKLIIILRFIEYQILRILDYFDSHIIIIYYINSFVEFIQRKNHIYYCFDVTIIILMKTLIVILLVAVSTSLSINSNCVSELSTIIPKLTSLHAKVNDRKFTSSFKELVGILKSLVSVKNSCSGKDGIDIK